MASRWANKYPEEATLIFEDWLSLKNQSSAAAAVSTPPVAAIPNFASKSKSWHEQLINAYRQEGEEPFLERETWHKDWMRYAKKYLSKRLEG